MSDVESLARQFFLKDITDRERAIFEGAITLGAIFHQFVGIPVCKDKKVIQAIKRAIETTMELQPYKEDVKVKINLGGTKSRKRNPYDYETLRGKHMDVRVISRYGSSKATLRMKYIPKLDYTLMYIEKIERA